MENTLVLSLVLGSHSRRGERARQREPEIRRFDSDNGPDSPRKPDDSDSDVSKSDEIDNVDDYLM